MEKIKNIKNHNTSNNHEESSQENEILSDSVEETLDSHGKQSMFNEHTSNPNEKLESNKNTPKSNEKSPNILLKYIKLYSFFIICLLAVLTPVFVERYKKLVSYNVHSVDNKPKYYLQSRGGQYLLKHVKIVLERLGWEQVPENSTDWDLFWAREFPFVEQFEHQLKYLTTNQRVINHIPGISPICNKQSLSASQNKYVPRSFLLPEEKNKFLDYAKTHTDALFLQKLNTHRGVILKNVSDMDYSGDSFAQEFMKNPFLIDGYKFDIGIYMVLISVNPLRIYWYKEDVLIRFCPKKYYPLDPSDVDQYVIADDYKPTWEIPSLAYYFQGLGLGMKGSIDSHMRTLNIDPETIWNNVTAAIADVFLDHEHHLTQRLKATNTSPRSFFELLRVDLMLDENLKVYVVEINFSPNLLAEDKPTNQLLYEQVLYNTFRITGIASRYKTQHFPVSSMVSAQKNIATWGRECFENCIHKCDFGEYCALCSHCQTKDFTSKLKAIHTENLNKGAFRRLFPPRLEPGNSPEAIMPTISKLSESNRLLYLWYQGKCNDDVTWCT